MRARRSASSAAPALRDVARHRHDVLDAPLRIEHPALREL